MKKNKYFIFYTLYADIFKELSARQCKKLILALCEKVETGTKTITLNKKGEFVYDTITGIIQNQHDFYAKNGRKGGLKRRKGVLKSNRIGSKESVKQG